MKRTLASHGLLLVAAALFVAACTKTELEVNISSDMGGDCHPLMSGAALSGKAAEVLAYKPGSCEPSGGELVGDVVLDEATTFCCRKPVI